MLGGCAGVLPMLYITPYQLMEIYNMAKRPEMIDEETDNVNNILHYDDDITTAERPDPLPEGEYEGVVDRAEVKTSARTGNKYVDIIFKVPSEQFPADYDLSLAPNGVSLRHMVMYSQSPRDKFAMRKFCETIGASTGAQINLGEWQGLSAKLTVAHETYEGEKNAKIKKVEAAA